LLNIIGTTVGALGLIIGYTTEMIYVKYTYYRLTKDELQTHPTF